MVAHILSFTNPKSAPDFIERDNLLTTSLREPGYRWSYASEYPIVLGPEAQSTSWCLHSQGRLVAHANLWPRTLLHAAGQKSFQVGLVGNVATHPDHRGHGHMKALLSHLAEIAPSQNLQALVLWSDLLGFYQNLGFRSIGREIRLRIPRSEGLRPTGIKQRDVASLSDGQLEALLKARPAVDWTLERSVQDFRTLLSIPDTHLFLRQSGAAIRSWLVIGKGSDMRGVIHEWGAFSADELVADIQSILHELDIPELLLLCPGNLHHHWIAPLKQRSSDSSPHHMALALAMTERGQEALAALAKGFIWGLDSI
jgi:GNAT superfamily N-acetyltransferase